MTRLRYAQVDAFADRPFAGNPAAVLMLDAWRDDNTLQAIAGETGLPATAFLVAADGDADHELRWFTPRKELLLCGHGTLAAAHVLFGDDRARDAIVFRTRRSGLVAVRRAGDGYSVALPAWTPAPRPLPEVVAALGVGAEATLWHPHGYALAVLADERAVRACAPDSRALAALGDLLAVVTAPGDATDIVSRAFAPAAGLDEDPVTGSAHAVAVPYWAARLGRSRLTARQASARGGRLDCALDGDRVVLGGACVTVVEGMFLLP